MTTISTGGVAVALSSDDPQLEEDVQQTIRKAAASWLKNEEVLLLLETFQDQRPDFPTQAAHQPPGGKLFIFNRKTCRSFRNDLHNWRKKADGRTVKETHEKLKVADQEKLNCYYAHADTNDGLQRRCYWILDESKADIVLVHYLCCATSRAGGSRGGNSHAAILENGGGSLAASRPRREAAQRARRYTTAVVAETDEEDPSLHNTGSAPDSSDYVPSSHDNEDLGVTLTPDEFFPGGNENSKGSSLPSFQQMHAQYMAAQQQQQTTGTGATGGGAASRGGRSTDGGTSAEGPADVGGGATLETAGASMEGPLFTQMSLGSPGLSQNLSGTLGGNIGNLEQQDSLLGMHRMSQDDSMKVIHRAFVDDPVNYSQLLNEIPGPIPGPSWRANTGINADALEAVNEASGLDQPQRSIKFSNRMELNSLLPGGSSEPSPLLAVGLMTNESSGLTKDIDGKRGSSGVSEMDRSRSSGAMSTKDAEPQNTTTAPASKAKTAPPTFVEGRRAELAAQQEGGSPAIAHQPHRSPTSEDDPQQQPSGFVRRVNPTAALARPSAADRSAAAANAAAAATHEQRELQLQKARQARLISPYDVADNPATSSPTALDLGDSSGLQHHELRSTGGGHDDDDDDDDGGLIDAPNADILFRLTSHMIPRAPFGTSASGGSNGSGGVNVVNHNAEQTAGLLKHMSIDEAAIADVNAATAVQEIDDVVGSGGGYTPARTPLPGVVEEGPRTGTTTTASEEKQVVESRDPSLSSLLESMQMPSATMALAPGDATNALKEAMAKHAAYEAAKKASRGAS